MATRAETINIIPAAAPTRITGSPVNAGDKAKALSPGAAVIYHANKPDTSANSAKYLKLIGDGTTIGWDSDDYADLAAADVQASITAANCLRVIVTVNGTPLVRVGSGATPSAGEFKVSGTSPITLSVGAAYATGSVIEVYILDASDITAESALTAGVAVEQEAADFMGTGVAVASLFV